MKVIEIDHGLQLLQETAPRTAGLHMSDIYGSLYKELDPKRYDQPGPRNDLKLAMGLAWEVYLERVLIASGIKAERPGEFTARVDGKDVVYSPDLFIVNGKDRIGEIKLSWMSSKGAIDAPKFDKWHCQVMDYLYLLDMCDATFYALFVNGSGQKFKAPEPELRVFDVTYSARELQENWKANLNHARQRKLL